MKERKIVPFSEKGCFKCKNFHSHYIFGRGGYMEINCGHCTKHKKKVVPDNDYVKCSFYEEYSAKEKRAKQKQHMQDIIERIDINLNNLMHYLKKR